MRMIWPLHGSRTRIFWFCFWFFFSSSLRFIGFLFGYIHFCCCHFHYMEREKKIHGMFIWLCVILRWTHWLQNSIITSDYFFFFCFHLPMKSQTNRFTIKRFFLFLIIILEMNISSFNTKIIRTTDSVFNKKNNNNNIGMHVVKSIQLFYMKIDLFFSFLFYVLKNVFHENYSIRLEDNTIQMSI